MKFISLLIFINLIFGAIYKFYGLSLTTIILLIIFNVVYLLILYIYKYEKQLFLKTMHNFKEVSNKPVILDNYKKKHFNDNINNQNYNPINQNYNPINNDESTKKIIIK